MQGSLVGMHKKTVGIDILPKNQNQDVHKLCYMQRGTFAAVNVLIAIFASYVCKVTFSLY